MHKCLLLVYCAVIVVIQHTITANFDLLRTRLGLGDTEGWGDYLMLPKVQYNFHMVVKCMLAPDNGRVITNPEGNILYLPVALSGELCQLLSSRCSLCITRVGSLTLEA